MNDRLLIDDADADCFVRARLHARRRFTDCQPVAGHVAFADDAFRVAVLGHVVGTFEHAILTADTLIVQMPDDAGNRIFIEGVDGTAFQASKLDAMVTRSGHMLQNRRFAAVAVQVCQSFLAMRPVELVLFFEFPSWQFTAQLRQFITEACEFLFLARSSLRATSHWSLDTTA